MPIEFKLPTLGEGIDSGTVVNVLISQGQEVSEGQNVLELETDKAVVEVPCSHGGKVVQVHVKPGDNLSVGAAILSIEESRAGEVPAPEEQEVKPAPEEKPAETEPVAKVSVEVEEPQRETVEPPASPPSDQEGVLEESTIAQEEKPVAAGPATRRFARELGVDLQMVAGTGPGGRITKDDVQAFVKKAMTGSGIPMVVPVAGTSVAPLPEFSQWGEVEIKPLSGIRRKTAEHMSLCWSTIPHVTQFDVADITDLEAARKRYNAAHSDSPGKLTVTVLALKAAVAALKEFPQFNTSLDAASGSLVYKKYYHIGVAVDTEHGLLVPVIRDVDKKNVVESAAELSQLAQKARNRKLTLDEMQGGTFTITNLGGIGGTAFTPIVNHPEVAILGLSRARLENIIVESGKPSQERLMFPISLSYDHRVIDGADGARFLRKVADMLADPLLMLLEG